MQEFRKEGEEMWLFQNLFKSRDKPKGGEKIHSPFFYLKEQALEEMKMSFLICRWVS